VLLSLEIMLNAANLSFVGFSRLFGQMDGQVFALAVMAVAAAEVCVGLGLIVAMARRRLALDVESHAAADAPRRVLALFDLNGFKHYNDTFGHSAGDKMLGMLGSRLQAKMTPEGTGYRLGGDEFVVLVKGRLGDRDAVAARAAEALSSHGSGFDLSAAWGIASVPEEADSATAAMQLADVRMYAQKESRRLAGPLGALDREALEQSH
jgi:diguanylate cyclase (GGDEF)-like protein